MPGEDKSVISDPSHVAKKIVDYIIKGKKSGQIIEIN